MAKTSEAVQTIISEVRSHAQHLEVVKRDCCQVIKDHELAIERLKEKIAEITREQVCLENMVARWEKDWGNKKSV